MFRSSLKKINCPRGCSGDLKLSSHNRVDTESDDVLHGLVHCGKCSSEYPILNGVLVLVADVDSYLIHHAKGLSKQVEIKKLPKSIQDDFQERLDEIRVELEETHIEEDLESDRVNALYLMNHYLDQVEGCESPAIQRLLESYWKISPLNWVSNHIPSSSDVVELGCGVGGLLKKIKKNTRSYLGVDSAFQSVLLARHIHFGAPYSGELLYPGDLFSGPQTLALQTKVEPKPKDSNFDFIVGEMSEPLVKLNAHDVCVTMNAIDMLPDPSVLPKIQKDLVRNAGLVIQTCPYVWHEQVVKKIRGRTPKGVQSSQGLVEWLYQKSGLIELKSESHIPWLFYKHSRQIELYSVHGIVCKKP